MANISIRILAAFLSFIAFGSATSVEELCVPGSDGVDLWVQSFTPWLRGWPNVTEGPGGSDKAFVNNMACWWYADCLFSNVPDTRKQQYAAVSIVMAFIPLVLKDIAWPHRRIVLQARRKHWSVEILVRALGLTPKLPEGSETVPEGRTFQRKWVSKLVLIVLVVLLLLSYGLLAVMEVYSKRSSLGCPMPAFIVLWFVIALLPAAIEVGFARYKVKKSPSQSYWLSTVSPNDSGRPASHRSVSESIQGGDLHWIVQFCWGLYYAAGSLIFTSIMLVRVAELFTWMLFAAVTTAGSKMLAYRLCGYWGTTTPNNRRD